MKIKIIVLIIVTINNISFGQDILKSNLDHFYKAEFLHYNNKMDSAIIYYREAFSDQSFGSINQCINSATKVLLRDSIEVAKLILRNCIHKGYVDSTYFNSINKKGLTSIDDIIGKDELREVIKNYTSNLDSFFILNLKTISEVDQFVRKSEKYFNKYDKTTGSISFDIIMALIAANKDELPSFRQLGIEGSRSLNTLIAHLELKQLLVLSPYIIRSIKNGEFYENENFLYQLERSSIDANVLLKLNENSDSIIAYGKNKKIENSNFYYSNYGGMDFYVGGDRGMIWWPMNPDVDLHNVNNLRRALQLPTIADLYATKNYIKVISESEFLKYANR